MDMITVNINSVLMVILYCPSNFLVANYLFKRLGIHWTLAIGCLLDCLCLWSRVLINANFSLAMVGGCFLGVAQPLIANPNAELASNWFSTREVALIVNATLVEANGDHVCR